MISGFAVNQVYLATGFTDMRKSINGLSLLVSEQLVQDPFSGSVFVFCNRARDKLKILYWETSHSRSSSASHFASDGFSVRKK